QNGFCSDHWRGGPTQRRRVLGTTVLRGARFDFVGACRLWTSPLSPICAASDRFYCFRAKDWILTRGNRRGTCPAAIGSHSNPCGLEAIVRGIDEPASSADR